jgi:hypothetical protein
MRIGREQRYRLLLAVLEDPEVAGFEVPHRILAGVRDDNAHLDEVGVGAERRGLLINGLTPSTHRGEGA